MQCNTVELDTSSPSPTLRFSPSFNVAVPFIDRHIAEGRAAKVAIRTIHGDVTYAQLAANVARCAGGLLRLGLRPGDRLSGPAVIEQMDATTVVPPGFLATVDDALNLFLKQSA